MPGTLDGKVVLVTGGTKGIGRDVCLKLASEGAKIVAIYHSDDAAAEALNRDIDAMGQFSATKKFDMAADRNSIFEMIDEVHLSFGGPDILIHCAAQGLNRPLPTLRLTQSHLEKTMLVNTYTLLFMVERLLEKDYMKAGDRILGFTSIGARRAAKNYATVGITKAAMMQLMVYFAVDLASKGISVNCLSPTLTAGTEGHKTLSGLDAKNGTTILKDFTESIPAGRLVTTEEVAEVAYHVLMMPTMVTGQVIEIDGGASLTA